MEHLNDPFNWTCKPCSIDPIFGKCNLDAGGMYSTRNECKEACDPIKCTGSQIFWMIFFLILIIGVIVSAAICYYYIYKEDPEKMKK